MGISTHSNAQLISSFDDSSPVSRQTDLPLIQKSLILNAIQNMVLGKKVKLNQSNDNKNQNTKNPVVIGQKPSTKNQLTPN